MQYFLVATSIDARVIAKYIRNLRRWTDIGQSRKVRGLRLLQYLPRLVSRELTREHNVRCTLISTFEFYRHSVDSVSQNFEYPPPLTRRKPAYDGTAEMLVRISELHQSFG